MNSEKEVRARVADLIRQQYRARGVRRSDFAKQLGITERTIAYWMDGTSIPKGDLQQKIEEMFGWPKGAVAGAIADGLSGTPVEELRIGPDTRQGKLADLPASVLADELLDRLRAADDQVRSLKHQLEDARRQLAQPDYSLAAHAVEDSMSERFEREARLRDSQESPDD